MASAHYNLGLKAFLDGTIVMGTDTIKVRLSRSGTYVFSQTHQFASSLAAAIGTDVTLGTKATNGGGGLDPGCFDAADATFTAVAAGAAIDSLEIYKDTGVAGTSPLIAYIDGFTVTPNGGDITIQWANAAPWVFKV
jgi:hypothetical protein